MSMWAEGWEEKRDKRRADQEFQVQTPPPDARSVGYKYPWAGRSIDGADGIHNSPFVIPSLLRTQAWSERENGAMGLW